MSRIFKQVVCFGYILLTVGFGDLALWAAPVERLEFNWKRDPEYFPFSLTEIHVVDWEASRMNIYAPMQVLSPGEVGQSNGLIAGAYNPLITEDSRAQIYVFGVEDALFKSDNPVSLTLTHFRCYLDDQSTEPAVLAGGYRRDSAFLVKIVPSTGDRAECGLTTGTDRTGDGAWRADVQPVWIGKLDGNSSQEAIIHVNTGRDLDPRELIGVDLARMTVKWRLPYASGVPGPVYICIDSSGKSVLFVSSGPGHGVKYPHISDRYCYLTRLGPGGMVLSNAIIGSYLGGAAIAHDAGRPTFYLFHNYPFLPDDREVDTSVNQLQPTLSLLDSLGQPLRSVAVDEYFNSMWFADLDGDGSRELYAMDRKGAISVYSQDLDLIVRSDATSLGAIPGLLPPVDEDDSTLLFNSPEGSFLFTTKLRPIAHLPQQADYAAAAETTPDGRMTVLVTSGLNRYQMVRLHRRSWFEYLSIFYLDYQYYVLALLTSLGVGLIIVNYYRHRVSSQKKVVEVAHRELASTHEQLKQTQQQLVEAEKYKQAQDIAGGFAHEIRNALFPAESSLKKIRQALKTTPEDMEKTQKLAETSVKAVERALDITDLISQYTKLESEIEREQVSVAKVVREMLTANETRISEQQVTVSVTGAVECAIDINPLHFYMILNNLLLNALDALTERPERVILISWEKRGDRLHLSFSDTGSGITAPDRARIFQPFFSTKPNSGTGLGLAIIQRLITIYHGEIIVKSEAGRGTTFVINLPLGKTRQSTTGCPM